MSIVPFVSVLVLIVLIASVRLACVVFRPLRPPWLIFPFVQLDVHVLGLLESVSVVYMFIYILDMNVC